MGRAFRRQVDPGLRPCRCMGGMGVRDAADLGEGAIELQMRRQSDEGRNVPSTTWPSRSTIGRSSAFISS